jgi:hypothetical protein
VCHQVCWVLTAGATVNVHPRNTAAIAIATATATTAAAAAAAAAVWASTGTPFL